MITSYDIKEGMVLRNDVRNSTFRRVYRFYWAGGKIAIMWYPFTKDVWEYPSSHVWRGVEDENYG